MRRLIVEILILTIFFGVLYAATLYQETYFGRTIVALGLDTAVFIYVLLLAYILLGFNRFTLPFKPFALAVALFFILEVVSFNSSERYPFVYAFFKSNELNILLFLVFLALAHVELPSKTSFQPLVTSAGLVLASYFGYSLISVMPVDYASELGIIFALILVVLAATVLANIKENEFATWLKNSRKFLVFFIGVFAAYYVFIRPFLMERQGLISVVEWVAVAVVFLKLSRDYKRSMKIDESEFIQPHKQKVSIRRDEWVEEFRKAENNFIHHGVRSHLIAALSKPLYDMGWSEERVARLISPIISYSDRKVPVLSFNWERKMIESRNKKDREKVVGKLIDKLNREGVGIGS